MAQPKRKMPEPAAEFTTVAFQFDPFGSFELPPVVTPAKSKTEPKAEPEAEPEVYRVAEFYAEYSDLTADQLKAAKAECADHIARSKRISVKSRL